MPGPDLSLTIEEVARELAGLDYAAAQRALQSVYRLAWLNLMQEVDRAMRSGAKPVAQVSRLLSSVTQTMRAADRGAAAWMSRYIPAAYSAGMKQADVQMALQGLRLGAPDSMAGVHMGAVREVARDAMQDLLAATQRVEENVKAAVRKVAREEIMTQVASGKRASGKRIAERMAEEEVYGVHDKRGRFIPMEEYARMVSHVKLRETHTKGMEGLIQEHGFDLVQISHHVHKPDICTPIEGKVYSITGNTPGWPKLPRHTPFHVGCRHVETPFVDTFLSDEKIAELQALSNQAEPVYTYTPEQLARADAKRAQRERGRKLRKERERKNAAAVASGKKKPVQAVKEEVASAREDEARGGFTGGRLPTPEEALQKSGDRKFTGEDPGPDFDARKRDTRVGQRYIGANGMKVKIGERDPDAVLEGYRRAIDGGVLPGFDRRDAEIVLRYVGPDGNHQYVYDRILSGDLRGLALLQHESVELKAYFGDGRYNPWKRGEHGVGYPLRHGKATVAEADLMLAIAKQKGYPVQELWDMIRADPSTCPPGASEEDIAERVQANIDYACFYLDIDSRTLPKEGEVSLAAAKRFWQDVDEGTLTINDIDFAALQDPRHS